jgi:hypothetical protein
MELFHPNRLANAEEMNINRRRITLEPAIE